MKILANTLWEIYAVAYDLIFFSVPHQRMFRKIVEDISLMRGREILDAGGGTSTLAVHIDKKGLPVRKVVTADLSWTMLTISRIKKLIYRLNWLQLVRVDLSKQMRNFKDNSFDTVVAINLIFIFSDLERFFREVFRVIKPQGVLITVWPKETFSYRKIIKAHVVAVLEKGLIGYLTLFISVIIAAVPLIIVLISNIIIHVFTLQGSYRVYSPDQISHALVKSGFRVVRIDSVCENQEWEVIAKRR